MRQAYVTDFGRCKVLRQQHIATLDVFVQNLQAAKTGNSSDILRAALQLWVSCPTPVLWVSCPTPVLWVSCPTPVLSSQDV